MCVCCVFEFSGQCNGRLSVSRSLLSFVLFVSGCGGTYWGVLPDWDGVPLVKWGRAGGPHRLVGGTLRSTGSG